MSCDVPALPRWGTFDSEKVCKQCNITLDCSFQPDGLSGGTIGGVAKGNLPADVDVAGIGTVWAFALPSAISLLCGFILVLSLSSLAATSSRSKKPPNDTVRYGKKNGISFAVVTHYFPHPGSPDPTKKPSGPAQKAYHFLEYIIRAISDLQILLALALAISFVVVGICEKLQYQVTIGVNLLLMTCANYLLTLGLVRHHWRSKIAGLAALLRLLAVAGIYFLLGWILSLQNDWRKRPHAAEYMPDKSRNSSAILLKAACFLDPAFQNTTLSQNTTTIPGQRNNDFGIGDNHGLAPEWIFGIFLAIVTTLVLTVRLLGSFTRLGRLDSDKAGMPTYMKFLKNKLIQKGYWWLIWVLSVVVYGYSAYTISGLRSWVSQSGWLKSGERGNPEDRVSGFGQIAALVLMVAVVIAALDNAALSGKRTGKQKDLNAKPKKGKHGRSWV